jgi:hypothetical protein
VDYQTIKIISNIFIISGATLFVAAVMLAFLRYKRTRPGNYYDMPYAGASPKEKEKRRKERMGHGKEVKVKHPETGEEVTAKGKDLHAEGAGIYVPVDMRQVRQGSKLELTLYLEGEDEPIKIGAEVAWTEGLEDKDMENLSIVSEFFARRIGLRFTDIDARERKKIDIYIEGITKESNEKES